MACQHYETYSFAMHVKCMLYFIRHVKCMRYFIRHVKCMRYLMVVTRMDPSKSGWTPYDYYTTLYSTPRYANLKSGKIRVKDNCARKRVGYRV